MRKNPIPKKQGEEMFIGTKLVTIRDEQRYSSRVEKACDEMIATGDLKYKEPGTRVKSLTNNLPLLAKKHKVKLSTLKKIFEI